MARCHLRVQGPSPGVRSLYGLGDQKREGPSPQRFAVHRDERVQRGDHEHHRGSLIQHAGGEAHPGVHHHVSVYRDVNHRHALSAVRAKGILTLSTQMCCLHIF